MVPLVWIGVAVGTEQILTGNLLMLPLSGLVSFSNCTAALIRW